MPSLLERALAWWELGVQPVPAYFRSKVPALAAGQLSYAFEHGVTREQVVQWFSGSEQRNIALITGSVSSLLVLDFDDERAFLSWEGPLSFYRVRTARGWHIYYRTLSPGCSRSILGIHVRAERALVVGAGSVHSSSVEYLELGNPAEMLWVLGQSDVLPGFEVCGKEPVLPYERLPGVVDRIRQAVPLLSIAETVIPRLRSSDNGRGVWYTGVCPFHDDHSPSAYLSTEQNRMWCFSPRCSIYHRGADVVDLYAVSMWPALYGELAFRKIVLRQAIQELSVYLDG